MRKFHSSEYLNALASGEICLVVGWSGDIKQAQKRAAEAKNGVEIGYAIPKEGAQMWFDNLAIPKDAEHVAEAHAFIDYLLRPEVAAKNSNLVSYANGNLASQKFIDKAVLDDKSVYPDAATMSRLYIVSAHDQKTQRADQPAVDAGQDRALTQPFGIVGPSGRHRRCSQSHCSGCSRIQPSTTLVMICMVPAMSILPCASRAGAIASVISPRKRLPGRRIMRMPWIGQSKWRASRAISGLALVRRPKKVTVDAAHVVLIDQHADMGAAFERLRRASPAHRGRSGSVSPMLAARILTQPAVDRADVGPAVEHRAVEAVATRREIAGSSQLARCAAKISAGLPSSRAV